MGLLEDDQYLGKCFKDKHTGHVTKITRRFTAIDGETVYVVKKLDGGGSPFLHLTETQLLNLYEFDPVATVLHGSTVRELQREMQIEKSIMLGTMYGTIAGRRSAQYFGGWRFPNKDSGN